MTNVSTGSGPLQEIFTYEQPEGTVSSHQSRTSPMWSPHICSIPTCPRGRRGESLGDRHTPAPAEMDKLYSLGVDLVKV